MATLTEGRHPGEFLLSEAERARSRDNITILAGRVLEPSTVLGKVTASGKYVALNPAASDGSETAAGILFHRVDAADGDVDAFAITRAAEVKAEALAWPDGITDEQMLAALDTLKIDGIIAR